MGPLPQLCSGLALTWHLWRLQPSPETSQGWGVGAGVTVGMSREEPKRA